MTPGHLLAPYVPDIPQPRRGPAENSEPEMTLHPTTLTRGVAWSSASRCRCCRARSTGCRPLPNGLAMIDLGYSLGRTRTDGGSAGAAVPDLGPYVARAGAA